MQIQDILNQHVKFFDVYAPALTAQEALSILVHFWKDTHLKNDDIEQIKHWIKNLHPDIRQAIAQKLTNFLPEFLRLGFVIFDEKLNDYLITDLPLKTFNGFWSVLSRLHTGQNLLPISVELKDIFCFLVAKAKTCQLNLYKQNLSDANISFWEIENADLTEVRLDRCKMLQCKIRNSVFNQASFVKALLIQCNFSEAEAKNVRFDNIKTSSFFMYKSNLIQSSWIEADLHGAYLVESDISHNDFTKADLVLANLQDCKAFQTRWNFANLRNADLHNCILNENNFYQSNLDDVDFTGSQLYDIQFDALTSKGAILKDAFMGSQAATTWVWKGAIK
jgi:uncharacterized protein YjbI with pentapeptide repeats